MTRVVCPVCHTGFEAKISRDNFALNCVACGVAFNAALFLSKDDYAIKEKPQQKSTPHNASAPAFAEPASSSTRTGGLPFEEQGQAGAVARREPAPVQPKSEIEMKALYSKLNEIRKNFNDKSAPVKVEVEKPKPQAAEPAAAAQVSAPVPAVPAQAEVQPKKNSRRPLLEGSFGPYDIEGEIARGGVGAVFRAREREGGREVALKVLLDGPEAGEAERERFQHECETAKALSLPGMVQVYAVGECDGRPFMAMELVNGRSLDRIIPEKSLSVNDCLILMKAVAETVGALHEAGYVHRDLKPGNILIDAFGSPKVADFGLVKSLDEITRLTASGLVCGTPAYMAPEQARGDGKAVDPRSDVWALGAVLYEMLTAKPPFQAENALRLMLKITKEQPQPPRVLNMKVPQDVHNIVMKCLEKNAEKRYASARPLAADIARFLNGEPLEMHSQSRETMQKLFARAAQNKRPVLAVCATVAAMVLVGVLARVLFSPGEAGPMVERGYQALSDSSVKDSERLALAEKYFRDAIALDARNAKASLGLGLCLARRGIDSSGKILDPEKVSEAMAATNHAAALDPKLRADCHAQVARFNMWMRQHADEAHELERAVALAPRNLRYHEALAMAYWNAGAQLNAPKYYKNAVAEFQYILSVDATYPKIREYIKQLQERFLAQQPAQGLSVAARERR